MNIASKDAHEKEQELEQNKSKARVRTTRRCGIVLYSESQDEKFEHSPSVYALASTNPSTQKIPSVGLPPARLLMFMLQLGRLGQADRVVAQVIDTVIFSQENITKDNQWSSGLGNVKTDEATEAAASGFNDIVGSAYCEVVSRQIEGHIGSGRPLAAVDCVCTIESFLSTDLRVDKICERGWKSNQGSASVKNDTSVVKCRGFLAKGDGIEINLPVCLASERDLDHLAGVMALVNTSKNCFRLFAIAAKIESEHRLVKQALVDHVVERGCDMIDRDGIIA